jgi:hypothetical protein
MECENNSSHKLFFFKKVFRAAGRKIDEIHSINLITQNTKPMKRIVLILTAVATTVIMSCNPSRSSTNNSNPSTTDTTMNNNNMSNPTDTTNHR